MSNEAKIVWTKIDEAPALATYSFLPILQSFVKGTGIEFETRDISLAGRILANFPEKLKENQKQPDDLAILGELVKKPEANIIKLPNISASIPQLQAAIRELQSQGYDLPDYPEEIKSPEDEKLKERYAKVLGSAVNPVLREGNSDRRAPVSVKKHSQKYPHKMMKPWPEKSRCRVAHMSSDDFFGTETSITMKKAGTARIEFSDESGKTEVLKDGIKLQDGEVIDSACMKASALQEFFAREIEAAKKEGVLFSLHLKATMMKVSDPIIFGHAVKVFYREVFEKHAKTFSEIGVNVNNGLADVYYRIEKLDSAKQEEIKKDIQAVYEKSADLAMVDSRKGITNLHVPNNVIIDASMPNVVRDGGKMWNKDDALQECIAVIPDRSYATMYQAVIEDCQKNGQFDPATMGSVANVGLMAQKAEEYGSHDKTFEIKSAGTVRVLDDDGTTLLEQKVSSGDIFRMCQVKDEPIKDWVKLAVNRARATGSAAVFWLDDSRAHDAQLITKVNEYLKDHDTKGLEILIKSPAKAMEFTCERIRQGKDVISVTGNVLRDYLTDLFPILELGTSARMLSIVPLLNGGGLFETGAGGSAPKHVDQFLSEGHLRWDSLGEFCAMAASFEHVAANYKNQEAQVLADTLDQAIGQYLENGRTPSRKVNEIDNRGSHFYLALYWAQALAAQSGSATLKEKFEPVAKALTDNEAKIMDELNGAQGSKVDIGGYFHPEFSKAEASMRPSKTLNSIIDGIS
ncbi:MAG TPA: NADP-dependent isocitrate dehydrogenase [Leptospiraceae bacterium]|nr:isocitrate dehydrogenase (NADP(+)) [Spirochaetaceae bacterium]HBS06976.1 NADP-dependent isocitrate dehydrogenase [Leptospiraceae bacterium]|tara:strand:+ start:42148 stop:44379 length:2232 start_codon:yes stop_codon:yes gene_type:complete